MMIAVEHRGDKNVVLKARRGEACFAVCLLPLRVMGGLQKGEDCC